MPVRRSFALIALATLVVCAVTARLGVWQLDRARQKTEAAERLSRQGRLPPLVAASLPHDDAALAEALARRVSLQGRWLPQHTRWLDNRPLQGQAGFIVVTPLQLADGRVLAVQRGWLPRDLRDPHRLPPLPTPDGWRQVEGRLLAWPSVRLDLGAADGPPQGPIRQNLSPDVLSRETGLRLQVLTVQQTAEDLPAPAPDAAAAGMEPGPAAAGPSPASAAMPLLRRDWPPPAADVGKHHAYAAQWFAFSALTAGLFIWFQLLRPRRPAPDHAPA